jgi:hypothetical protein
MVPHERQPRWRDFGESVSSLPVSWQPQRAIEKSSGARNSPASPMCACAWGMRRRATSTQTAIAFPPPPRGVFGESDSLGSETTCALLHPRNASATLNASPKTHRQHRAFRRSHRAKWSDAAELKFELDMLVTWEANARSHVPCGHGCGLPSRRSNVALRGMRGKLRPLCRLRAPCGSEGEVPWLCDRRV